MASHLFEWDAINLVKPASEVYLTSTFFPLTM